MCMRHVHFSRQQSGAVPTFLFQNNGNSGWACASKKKSVPKYFWSCEKSDFFEITSIRRRLTSAIIWWYKVSCVSTELHRQSNLLDLSYSFLHFNELVYVHLPSMRGEVSLVELFLFKRYSLVRIRDMQLLEVKSLPWVFKWKIRKFFEGKNQEVLRREIQ